MLRSTVILLAALAATALPASAGAITITPTRLDNPTGHSVCDPSSLRRDCSLRQAVAVAETQDAIISLAPPAPQGTYRLTRGTLPVTGAITIAGTGARKVTTALPSPASGHVLSFFASESLVSGVTITGGNDVTDGGIDVANSGVLLTLKAVSVTGNLTFGGKPGGVSFGGEGAGISNFGELVISDSTIAGNQAFGQPDGPASRAGRGGGIYNAGTLIVSNSTIAANDAGGAATNGSAGAYTRSGRHG